MERENLQLDGQVDLAHVDVGRHREHTRSEVEDAGDARVDQHVGDRLGGAGRGGDHADGDVLFHGDAAQLFDVTHGQALDLFADLGRVGVEERDDLEAAAGEAVVAGQRVTEVTETDQADRPALVEAEHVLDLLDQQGDVVADAPRAVRPQVGKILAELGRVDPGRRGQSLAGDGVRTGL